MNWIPTSESLPNNNELIYATVRWNDDGYIEPAVGYRLGEWRLMDGYGSTFNNGYTVIAWMPLPKPYEPNDEHTDCPWK